MSIGENIYTYRTQHNLSQGELANEVGVSRQSVSKWENNAALPELDKLIKMSKLFSVTLDELVYGPVAVQKTTAAAATVTPLLPAPRVIIGMLLLMFGMIAFLLSMFWGDHLAFGEEVGELVSLGIIVFSIAMVATYNHKVLAGCAIIYFLYAVTCIGIVHVVDVPNYLFMFYTSIVLFVWFLLWGYNSKARLGMAA